MHMLFCTSDNPLNPSTNVMVREPPLTLGTKDPSPDIEFRQILIETYLRQKVITRTLPVYPRQICHAHVSSPPHAGHQAGVDLPRCVGMRGLCKLAVTLPLTDPPCPVEASTPP